MRSCGSRKLRLSAFQRECPDSLLYLRLIFIRRTLTAAALCHIAGDRTREQSSSCVPCEFRSSVSPVRSQRSCILLRSKALGPGPGWHRPSSLLCRTVPPFPAPPTAAKIVRAPCAPRAALLSILFIVPLPRSPQDPSAMVCTRRLSCPPSSNGVGTRPLSTDPLPFFIYGPKPLTNTGTPVRL